MKCSLTLLQVTRLCHLFPLMHVCVFESARAPHQCIHTVACVCAHMPLPALAVLVLRKPMGSMLVMRDFMREKERAVREVWQDEVGADATRLQFPSVSERATSSDHLERITEHVTILHFLSE